MELHGQRRTHHPAAPYITLLLGIASPNAVIGAIVIVGFIAWLYFLISPQLVVGTALDARLVF